LKILLFFKFQLRILLHLGLRNFTPFNSYEWDWKQNAGQQRNYFLTRYGSDSYGHSYRSCREGLVPVILSRCERFLFATIRFE
jgi:hypothetical protein